MHEDPAEQSPEHREALLELVHSFHGRLHGHYEKSSEADRCRREWILFDMATAAVRGVLADGVLDQGFDAIDTYDGREWLAKHGCHDASYNSSMVRGMYDLVFAYEQGDIKRANFAAGTAVRATLRILFDYKGSITYKMQAGMGDTIFSPLYLMLKNRGVKFEYFHKVTNLGLSADKDGRRHDRHRRPGEAEGRLQPDRDGEGPALLAEHAALRPARERRRAPEGARGRAHRPRIGLVPARRREKGPAAREGLRPGRPGNLAGRGQVHRARAARRKRGVARTWSRT